MTESMRELIEADVTYLYNSYRHFPNDVQNTICVQMLEILDAPAGAAQHSPADLVYLKSIWRKVYARVQEKALAEAE